MKKRLKTLFYGMSHEHAPGKIATLRKLTDDFEVVAIADDTANPLRLHLLTPRGCTCRLLEVTRADSGVCKNGWKKKKISKRRSL